MLLDTDNFLYEIASDVVSGYITSYVEYETALVWRPASRKREIMSWVRLGAAEPHSDDDDDDDDDDDARSGRGKDGQGTRRTDRPPRTTASAPTAHLASRGGSVLARARMHACMHGQGLG